MPTRCDNHSEGKMALTMAIAPMLQTINATTLLMGSQAAAQKLVAYS